MFASAQGHQAVYDTLVALHVFTAVLGFGAVALSGIYAGLAGRPAEPGAAEESARYFRQPGRAEWLVLAVPVLGAAALGFRPGGADFAEVWVVAGLAIWGLAASLLIGVVRPAERQLRRSVPGGRPPAHPARRLKWAAAACDVLFVAALVLMIGQPA